MSDFEKKASKLSECLFLPNPAKSVLDDFVDRLLRGTQRRGNLKKAASPVDHFRWYGPETWILPLGLR
jgi:hypothetical protein